MHQHADWRLAAFAEYKHDIAYIKLFVAGQVQQQASSSDGTPQCKSAGD